jgi:hypothetical protein
VSDRRTSIVAGLSGTEGARGSRAVSATGLCGPSRTPK